jgi:acyl carrier protein
MTKEKIREIVFENISSLIDTFPADQRVEVDENTILFGKGSSIDSLSLVTIIVDIETLFYDEYSLELSLTDDKAMTRKVSPFESAGTLADYIFELINQKQS